MAFDGRPKVGGRQEARDIGPGLAQARLGQRAQPGVEMGLDPGPQGRAVGVATRIGVALKPEWRERGALGRTAAARTAPWKAAIGP